MILTFDLDMHDTPGTWLFHSINYAEVSDMSVSLRKPAKPAHAVHVSPTRGRYPFAAACSCGWFSRGYAADHAAQIMADDHAITAPPAAIYGPARPNAGRAAWFELEQAQAHHASFGGWAPDSALLRLRKARANADQYWGYSSAS